MNPLYAVLPALFGAVMGKATPAAEAQVLHPNLAAQVAATSVATPLAAPVGPAIATVNEGPVSGPLTPVIGGAVATPRGLANLALEGFSEDLNMDGFVDPIAPAVHAAPLAAAPLAAAPLAAPANFAAFPTLNGAIA